MVEEWPTAGSDDLSVWPYPLTPEVRRVSVKLPSSNLDLGQSPREFKNHEVLKENGITHVLNCVGFFFPEHFKGDLKYLTLWLRDSPSEDITSILYDVFDYLEDVREQGGRVFVHCSKVVSRSNSLVIAYLTWREKLSFEDALRHVKAARGVTNPNVGFACRPLQFQKRVHDNARTTALKVIRYEKAQVSVLTSREGEKTSEFWKAIGTEQVLVDDDCHKATNKRQSFSVS